MRLEAHPTHLNQLQVVMLKGIFNFQFPIIYIMFVSEFILLWTHFVTTFMHILSGERKFEILQPEQTSYTSAFNESKLGNQIYFVKAFLLKSNC